MMIYERLPRPDGLQLTREQLRVYMMCNGRRALEEVAALTRLPLSELQSALKDLQQLNLLAPAALQAAPSAAPLPSALHEQLVQTAQAALNALPDDALPGGALPGGTARAATEEPAAAPAFPHTLPGITAHLRGVLTEHLGGRAAPYVAQISACRDLTELSALVPKMAAKIKLVIHEQAGSALKDAFAQCMAAHAAQEAGRA